MSKVIAETLLMELARKEAEQMFNHLKEDEAIPEKYSDDALKVLIAAVFIQGFNKAEELLDGDRGLYAVED